MLSAVRQRSSLPLELLLRAAHNIAASFIKASKGEFTSKAAITILRNIIVEVTCCILVVISKSQVPPMLRRKGLGKV